MVADDSAVIRGIVSRWVDADKDLVIAASAVNGQDAIERARTAKPDVIVLDIEMPIMDGITALPLLLKARPCDRLCAKAHVFGWRRRGGRVSP